MSIYCKHDTVIAAAGVLKCLTMFVSSVSKRCRITLEKNLTMMNCWRLQLPSYMESLFVWCISGSGLKTPWHTVFTWCSHLFTSVLTRHQVIVISHIKLEVTMVRMTMVTNISISYKGCHLTLTPGGPGPVIATLTLIVSLCHICDVSHNNKTTLVWGAIRYLLLGFQQLADPTWSYTPTSSQVTPGWQHLTLVIRDLDQEQCRVWQVSGKMSE